ncbi:glycosyltransferase [uncultured Phenylobacterium sp.]|uniref:glycosyltransferase n=1 Tax=uncultured Phenylobacterium sp. TaxID=349273 RepID=UPI0025D2CD02|nr:glycosyltransferase [uncultured Phenylobacterium sp.]
MPRIVYLTPAASATTGGNKVSFRHVEALVGLGYDAVVRAAGGGSPDWFEHKAPVEVASGPPGPDDILVFPEDAAEAMATFADVPNRKVVFCQNPYMAAAQGIGRLPPQTRARYRTFMACSPGVALWISRYLDHDLIGTVPAFADERLFVPAPKTRTIAAIPRKRRQEALAVRHMFGRLHPGADAWTWDVIAGRTEAETAAALGRASVFLSLARLEGMSMTILEAMACGCLVAGFTGIGPREYTTTMNGLWVGEDDCEAAAIALARACTMAEQDEAGAHLIRHAARVTAAKWTHASFVTALDLFWREAMGVTPATR